jgi:hypothetical protein
MAGRSLVDDPDLERSPTVGSWRIFPGSAGNLDDDQGPVLQPTLEAVQRQVAVLRKVTRGPFTIRQAVRHRAHHS